MRAPGGLIVTLAAIAALEGLGLVGYAIFDVVEAVRIGTSGPAEVSNTSALVVLIAIQVIFGVGMLWIARGWWRCARWARSPFVVAQLLGVLIGLQVAQGAEAGATVVGYLTVVIAIAGLVVAFLPPVTRALDAGTATS